MISYNPGYQSVLKDLKPSTRQRFVAIAFGYPDAEREAMIIAHESGVEAAIAERLAVIGAKTRQLADQGFDEGVSTRLLTYTGQLIRRGIEPAARAKSAIVHAVSDDATVQQAVADVVDVVLP